MRVRFTSAVAGGIQSVIIRTDAVVHVTLEGTSFDQYIFSGEASFIIKIESATIMIHRSRIINGAKF